MRHCETCRCEEKAQTIVLPEDFFPNYDYELRSTSDGVEVIDERGHVDTYWTRKLTEATKGYKIIQFGGMQ